MNKQTIATVFGFQRGYLGLLVDDIPDAKMTEQPKGLPNHPAWQIGHLTIALEGLAVGTLGGAPTLSDDFKKKFGMGSSPTPKRADYPSKTELLRAYDTVRAKATEAFLGANEATLSKPTASPVLSQGLPTAAHVALFFMLTHEATHLGQIAVWRQSMGMRPALEALMQQGAAAR